MYCCPLFGTCLYLGEKILLIILIFKLRYFLLSFFQNSLCKSFKKTLYFSPLEDNNLDEDKLKDYLKVVFKDNAELQTLASDAFISCASKIDEFKDKMGNRPPRPSPPPGAPRCPMRPAFLMGCVYRKVLKNCPESIWNDNQECNDAREFFANCKPPGRRPSSGEK